jgi:hypothetical protein
VIDDLDRTLERLLREKAPLPPSQFGVSFVVPTRAWAAALQKSTVNLYLHDVRENHDLRLDQWHDDLQPDGTFRRRPPVVRLDCFYVVTTWSADGTPDPFEAHRLLGLVLQTLLAFGTLPEEVLQGVLVGQEPPLPYLVAQLEGLPQPPAEFWSALDNRLSPSINLVVTIAMPPHAATEAPARIRPVRSQTIRAGQLAGPVAELTLQGRLRRDVPTGSPVRAAAAAAAASGALATPVFAAPTAFRVADGHALAANAWVLLDDELVRTTGKPADGPAIVTPRPPLAAEHAAGTAVQPADVAVTAAARLAGPVAPGAGSLAVADGKLLALGDRYVLDDGERAEGVRLASAGAAGPATVTLATPLRFGHEGEAVLRKVTLFAPVTSLAEPANRPEKTLTLAAAPAPAPAAGAVIRVGTGAAAEFATVAGTAGSTVSLADRLQGDHATGEPVHEIAPGARLGALARPALAGTAAAGVAGAPPGAIRAGQVVLLEGPPATFAEVTAVTTVVGAIEAPGEVIEQIGGRVLDDGTPPAPITGAQVHVVERPLARETDAAGRFLLSELAPGTYRLRVSAHGYAPREVQVQVPATRFDEYDVALSPL